VHNTPLSVAVELGGIGLLLFVGAFVLLVWGVRRSAPNHRALAMSLLATWCVGCSSLTWEARKATWFVILIGAVLGSVRGSERS
jgi:O-antigen ligase